MYEGTKFAALMPNERRTLGKIQKQSTEKFSNTAIEKCFPYSKSKKKKSSEPNELLKLNAIITGAFYGTQSIRLSRDLKRKSGQYHSIHNKIILLSNNNVVDETLLGNTELGSPIPPVVFSRH